MIFIIHFSHHFGPFQIMSKNAGLKPMNNFTAHASCSSLPAVSNKILAIA
ncbi:MAG TPA: hypothetical protein VJ577_19135 [Burkholderiaceae bacterium]|nr:hypothetical protein [Burkholderiaceae bacterium]